MRWGAPFWKRFFWFFLPAAVLGALASSEGVRGYFRRRHELSRLNAQWAQTQRRVAEKRRQMERAQKDDVFLEGEARRQLGLVRPGEIEFRFVPSSAAAGGERMSVVPPPEDRP